MMIPTTKKVPPIAMYATSLTQPKTLPERIIPKQDEAEMKVMIGPIITMRIPRRNTSARKLWPRIAEDDRAF